MNTAKWEQNVLQRLQSDQAMTLDCVFGLSKERPSDVYVWTPQNIRPQAFPEWRQNLNMNLEMWQRQLAALRTFSNWVSLSLRPSQLVWINAMGMAQICPWHITLISRRLQVVNSRTKLSKRECVCVVTNIFALLNFVSSKCSQTISAFHHCS